MILCDAEIRTALSTGQIRLDPEPAPERIQTSSVDLALGDELKRWKATARGLERVIDPSSPGYAYHDLSKELLESFPAQDDGSIVLEPGQFLLGITRERLELPIPSRIAARVEGRSSLARLGIGVHMTAPTIHAGFRGKITLEITNQGAIPVRLRPGMIICQLILEQVFGTPTAMMVGAFQDQTSVVGKKQ